MRFFKALKKTKLLVFWLMTLCNSVGGYRFFGGSKCLRLQLEQMKTGDAVRTYIHIVNQKYVQNFSRIT
jgi:hypothetical protein